MIWSSNMPYGEAVADPEIVVDRVEVPVDRVGIAASVGERTAVRAQRDEVGIPMRLLDISRFM